MNAPIEKPGVPWWLQPGNEQFRCAGTNKKKGDRCARVIVVGEGLCVPCMRKAGKVPPPEDEREARMRKVRGVRAPIPEGTKFGNMTVGKLLKVEPELYDCVCTCGNHERRSRTNISSSKASGRLSACKACVLAVRHKNHTRAEVARLGEYYGKGPKQ